MASDNKIIELIKQGDIAAFNTLFKSVYLQLYIHCRKFIPDPEDAKDILQNVFLRFWEKRENIDIHTSLNAYYTGLYRTNASITFVLPELPIWLAIINKFKINNKI